MIIIGTVNKVYTRGDGGFKTAAFRLTDCEYGLAYPSGKKLKNGDMIGIMGKGLPEEGQIVKAKGEFKPSESNMLPTFVVESVLSVEGEADNRALLLTVKGIGPSIADKICEELKSKTIDALIKDPGILEKLNLSRFQDVIESTFSQKITPEDFSKLSALGFNQKQISIMTRMAKSNVYQEFNENPYNFILMQEMSFQMIDSIAKRKFGFSDESPERLEAAVEYLLKGLENSGSTYFKVDDIFANFKGITGINDRALIDKRVEEMIKSGKLWFKRNKHTKKIIIGLMDSMRKEKRIAEELLRMSQTKIDLDIAPYISQKEKTSGFTLANSQREAVEKALSNQVFILKGGPGTGKTFTLTSIIDVFQKITGSDSIVCLAPTGRAAKRMTEQTGRASQTIHSYLKIQPGRMETNVEITADLLVVDESSMLDLEIAYALITSLSTHTSLIFVGDTNQLPSIGAGNILADMIKSKVIPSVQLEVVYRQSDDSTISKNANKILSNNPVFLVKEDFEVLNASSPLEAQRLILRELKRATKTYGIVETCVLTPLRKNKLTSVNIINPLAQSLLNPESPHKTQMNINGKVFRVGDKVMITRNSAIAANGDVGVITDMNVKANEIEVDLGYGKPILLNSDELNTLDLAYSMSIHKSQGSEYDCVIIVVMDEHASLLQKNLIYTAVTRAKKKVVLISQDSAIEKSIAGKPQPRYTLLSEMLEVVSKK